MIDADRWRAVQRVLDAALTCEPTEWPALLERTCSGDPELRRHVESLLARLDEAQDFLESPPAAVAATLIAEARDAEAGQGEPGRRIGAYRILHEIGRGGMARVFLAERADGEFERRVAIKLLRPGLDTELDRERFRAERRILASLDHPHIARLFDGGVTEEGQPYLVLEHVDGQPIDAYCDGRALSIRQRLDLFLTVCEATRYAHRNLIVHRDLKPSNILVGADGAVKLLDFGLAKLLEARAAQPSLTQAGQRWMTPEYAAPEQVRGEAVTTSTDVYQLGAVLFRLLAGRTPLAGRTRMPELEDAVLHVDPEPPSRAIDGEDPARGRALRGDLDAIVLKALRKEPVERYASVDEMAADVRRHLTGQPVQAHRQTTGYRARRFVRRHRMGVAAAAAIALLLIAWAVTATVQRGHIRAALAEATLGAQRAEQVTDFMLGLFRAVEAGRTLTDTVTARALLTRGVEQARALAAQPAVQAQMLDVIGRLYTQLGEYERAVPLLEEALALRLSLYGEHHPDYVMTLENLAEATDRTGDIAGMLVMRQRIIDLRRRVSGPLDRRTVDARFNLGLALHRAGNIAAADSALDAWAALTASQPSQVTEQRAAQLTTLAILLELRIVPERAEATHREALAMRRTLYGERHALVATNLAHLGSFLIQQGRAEEAEPLLREAVAVLRASHPDGHPELATALRQWGNVLGRLARFREGQAPLRESVALMTRSFGPDAIEVAMVELDLAFSLTMDHGYEEAAGLARHAGRTLTAQLGADNSMVFLARISLGDALRGLGRLAEAESLLIAGYRRFENPRPVTVRWHRYAAGALARLYEAQGRSDEAAEYRQRAESATTATTSTADRPH